MTNSTTEIYQVINRAAEKANPNSDTAPMVVTRLSGWIDVGELKSKPPAWIVPTRPFIAATN